MVKYALKWRRPAIIYPSDHIVSSRARENGLTAFKLPYEEEQSPNMAFIMSNEYMRMWYKEKAEYEKDKYSEEETKVSERHSIKRRYVQRMMTNPKPKVKEIPIIQMKRFQNIMAKVDNRNDNKKVCSRYGETYRPVPLQRYKPDCR